MYNILVCDDDREIVDAIEIYLTQEGYHVLKAYDGMQAIQMLEREEIQLLIIDVMMPKLDGIRATLKISNDDLKEVSVEGEPVKLTPIEYNILLLLVKNPGKVFSIEQIYESIWNEEAIGADNTVAVHIRHIREKIEINPKEPRYLKVVWGIGYKIEKQ